MVEGWLIKRAGGRSEVMGEKSKRGCGSIGELRRKWEYRFFVVSRGKLNYYRSPEAYQQGVAPAVRSHAILQSLVISRPPLTDCLWSQGTIQLRNASMWEYEREEEKIKGRVHKFVIVTPDRLYYMCAETRDDLEMWCDFAHFLLTIAHYRSLCAHFVRRFEGVASVICQAMRGWSPAEVATWLAMNRLGHLSEVFQASSVNGMMLNVMDCEEGLDQALVSNPEDRGKLIEVLQMV